MYEGEEPVYIAPKKKQKKTAKADQARRKEIRGFDQKESATASVASVEKKAVTRG